MLYLYITDDKGERFNLLPGRILYLTEVFTKPLLLAKMKSLICDVIPDYHLSSFPSECHDFLNHHRTHPFQSTPKMTEKFYERKVSPPIILEACVSYLLFMDLCMSRKN